MVHRYIIGLIVCHFLYAQIINAQTDVYQFQIHHQNGKYSLENPRLLSHFNVNNSSLDPYMIDSSTILMTCNYPDSTNNDIWSLNVNTRHYKRITHTIENERQIKFQKSKKRYLLLRNSTIPDSILSTKEQLWFYPKNQENAGNIVIPATIPIHSFDLISDEEILILYDRHPKQLALLNLETFRGSIVSNKVGDHYCFKSDTIHFIYQHNPQTWYLKTYQLRTKSIKTIFKLPLETSIFGILNSHQYIFADQSVLYLLDLNKENKWSMMLDLSYYGINKILDLKIQFNSLIITTQH